MRMRTLPNVVASLVLATSLAVAQTPARDAPQPDPSEPLAAADGAVFRTETNLIVLHASVFDKDGKLVTDLPQSAFKVFENGVEQPLSIFRREDAPVSMGIVIDNSGSMREKRAKVAAATLALVRASNPQDEVFIMNFNDDAYLEQSFTGSISKLEEALQKIDSRGGTAMRDAISLSLDYAKDKGREDKKVLLVVTDGNDNNSVVSLPRLLRKEQQSDVLIYCIGLLNEEEPREAEKARSALTTLAQASGGLAFYPKDLAEIGRITPEVAHEIRNQYTLGYSPKNQTLDGTFRKITVTVDRPGLTVRARNGYYATPAPVSTESSNPN